MGTKKFDFFPKKFEIEFDLYFLSIINNSLNVSNVVLFFIS